MAMTWAKADPKRVTVASGGLIESPEGLPRLKTAYGEVVATGLEMVDEVSREFQCKDNRCLRVIPQFPVKDEEGDTVYRLDFGLFWPRSDGKGYIKLAVECDGHDYHEKTKEQARRDKEKDRYLKSHGWEVVRFTGSEIYEDPGLVWREIRHIVWAKEEDFQK